MPRNLVTIVVGGSAGDGVMRTGEVLCKWTGIQGFYSFGMIDYPSLIRGGHNFFKATISKDEVHMTRKKVDILLALNKDTVERHIDELSEKSLLIYDGHIEINEVRERFKGEIFTPPLTEMALELGGPKIIRNSVALGLLSRILGLNIEGLIKVFKKVFMGGEKLIDLNIKASKRGLDYARRSINIEDYKLELGGNEKLYSLTGNEAVGLGALRAGCTFYAAYPMTPASPILHFLAKYQKEAGIIVIQPESEIAAINMAIGASYAGCRAMTATSGGGFSLMAESIGMAAMTETPVVVVVSQRPGPSTGMATYTAQGDLLEAVHISHGEFQRVVLAPGDVEECFYLTAEAFNISDIFQLPVILLIDKHLSESYFSIPELDQDHVKIERGKLVLSSLRGYKRYRLSDDGISPRAVPGVKGVVVRCQSSEHTEEGFATVDPLIVKQMMDKRAKKIEKLKSHLSKIEPVKFYGSEDPDILIVGWGSTKGAILDSIKMLDAKGVKVSYLQYRVLEPFPFDESKHYIEKAGAKLVIVENNMSGQLEQILKCHFKVSFYKRLFKYDGRPLYPSEIVNGVLGD